MATKMSLLPRFSRNSSLLTPKCLRSRYLLITTPPTNAVTSSWEFYPQLVFCATPPSSVYCSKRFVWSIRSSLGGGDRSEPPNRSSTNGGTGTRLVRAIQDFRIRLNTRIQELKKGLPVKILFFLVGFYCATAFSTVIGQTGDWDILSAGLAVVVVEGIGALMYRTSFRLLEEIKSLVTVFNYWKAGLSLGLFLDAFKYEMENVLELCNPFNLDIGVFSIFC